MSFHTGQNLSYSHEYSHGNSFSRLRESLIENKTLKGVSHKIETSLNQHHFIHHFDHQLGRLAALESAFRPNLSLGTQVAFFVTLRVLNYIISIISLGG